MDGRSQVGGHAFLSYVREDSALVDQLEQVLRDAGIPVWRDRSALWPGEDWREKIREAITDDALVFIACFSTNSLARARSYQNEELVLAVEQLRLRRPEQPWLIPVRLDDCELPDLEVGGGRRLSSHQWVDVFGDGFNEGAARLVAAIRRILGPPDARNVGAASHNLAVVEDNAARGIWTDPTALMPTDDRLPSASEPPARTDAAPDVGSVVAGDRANTFAPTSRRPALRPYFFLSYARTPKRDPADKENPDRWVYKLYRDLCDVVLLLTDAAPEEAGFMDREDRLGLEWNPELVSALKGCRVFVPLYSRRYFESSYCGKEWFEFARREATKRAQGGEIARAIVPALWTRVNRDSLPDVAQSVQFDHSALGERYSKEGFYGIMRLQNYRSEYRRAVHWLAERIVEVGDANIAYANDDVAHEQMPAPFESLPSAFGPGSASRTTSQQIHIVIIAPHNSTLPPGRSREYYGITPGQWNPYRPDYPLPLAEYELELLRKCLDARPVEITIDDLVGWHSPGSARPPTLVLVDPWAAMIPEYQQQLRAIDELEESWIGVLIPWNSKDRDLSAVGQDLRLKLREHLGRKLASVPRRCKMAASGIPTLEDFGQILPDMAMILLRRYRKSLPVSPADPSSSGHGFGHRIPNGT